MITPEVGLGNRADRQPVVAPWHSRRLWSRWDMIRQSIWSFVNLGIKFHNFQLVLNALDSHDTPSGIVVFQGLKGEELDEKRRQNLSNFIDDLLILSRALDLPTSTILLMAVKEDVPRTAREFNLLILAVRAEVHKKLFLYVPTERAPFFEKEDILSARAANAFPNAYKELIEAGNCYAAERYTACVFHAMRAAEIGLRALGEDVGVTFPDKPIELAEWANIIEQAESKIKTLVNKGPAQEKDDNRKFYGQAAAQFRYFKDGWRIRVAHARESYSGSQALNVLNHACDFFEDLATRLAEPL